ncbi:MAG TPA: hypothetical protein VFG73_02420 [Rhodanobacteraceae bacterium]|nr:hypothetical protein [Rhodanobacteraceae bacterium]
MGRWLNSDWTERGLAALRATLDVDASVRRDMIEFLFAEGFWNREKLTWDAALARWNGCLNPRKSEFFKIGEVWALMKRFHRYELLRAMAEDLGCELRIRPSEEQQQRLMERLAEATEHAAAAVAEASAELARFHDPAPARPSRMGGETPRFALVESDDDAGQAPGGF